MRCSSKLQMSLDGSGSCLFQVALSLCPTSTTVAHLLVVVGPTVKSRRGVWSSLARLSLECLQVKEDVIQPYQATHDPLRSEEEGNSREQGSGQSSEMAITETGFGHSHASSNTRSE